jgi:hypothetical protein
MSQVDAGESIELKGRADCEIRRHEGSKLEFRFGKDGSLAPLRSEFRDPKELVQFVAETYGLESQDGGLRGSIVRRGKYERRGPGGERAFTFGDPILDLISTPTGQIRVGSRTYDLAREELRTPSHRGGGVRTIDLSVLSREAFRSAAVQAAMGYGAFSLIEATADGIALASSGVGEQEDFEVDGDCMRFKAWRKNYAVYWSMGAEIETWGHDFDSATIESSYLDTFVGQVCTEEDHDSDSDTDDDYVDEYEWGISAPQPLRVVSTCTADWHGRPWGGVVAAGEECFLQ